MLFVVGFSLIPGSSSSSPTTDSSDAAQKYPQLLALESTEVPLQRTITTVLPTSTSTPDTVLVATAIHPTPTALLLSHEQRPDVIGHSVEGRPLNLYTFGTGEHQRMIVADIHGGDEWNTLTFANQMIKYVNQHPDAVPDDVTLYILPSLNPDGEARAHDKYGRLNYNGVDLNRNFPVNWLADWTRAGCWNYLPSTSGTGPGSEAETQALMNFINSHKLEALISYHSAALGIFPGGNPPDEISVQLAEAIAQVSTYHYPPLDTGCTYSGTLADYAASRGIAAVDLELTNHFDTDFDQNLEILNVLLNFAP